MAEKYPDYWKVKAALFEARLAMLTADAKLAAVLRAAGLDPAKNYALNDDEESITDTEGKADG